MIDAMADELKELQQSKQSTVAVLDSLIGAIEDLRFANLTHEVYDPSLNDAYEQVREHIECVKRELMAGERDE